MAKPSGRPSVLPSFLTRASPALLRLLIEVDPILGVSATFDEAAVLDDNRA